MNKLIFILFCSFLISQVSAQQLQNTTWKTVLPTSPDTNTVIATTDTLYVNGPTGSNLVTALFAEQGDTLKIRDLFGPAACTSPDTGLYNFNITGDTLTFSLIYDSCASRVFVLDGGVLWRDNISTSIDILASSIIEFSAFPNPSNGQISFVAQTDGKIEIRSLEGKILIEKYTLAGKSTINTNLPNGNFIIVFRSKDKIAHEMIYIRH